MLTENLLLLVIVFLQIGGQIVTSQRLFSHDCTCTGDYCSANNEGKIIYM